MPETLYAHGGVMCHNSGDQEPGVDSEREVEMTSFQSQTGSYADQ